MNVEVHIESSGNSQRVGTLFASPRGSAIVFEYASEWLARPDAFAIDPTSLPLRPGPQHSPSLHSVIMDCGPDRWGRVLIERAVRRKLLPRRPLQDIDYVLALDDGSRIGALRFKTADSPFLAATTGRLPPVVRLAALQRATDAIHHETESAADLRFLLGEGSPLGGARPKSAVMLPDGTLGIAKFRKPDDTRDVAAGEVLALRLAEASGIRTAASQLVAVGKARAAVIRRFDRDAGKRVPFLSAATLIDTSEQDPGSYVAIAEAIRRFGDHVLADLAELWRRMVFSLLIANCDDHVRKHGFLMLHPGRWSLSPAYDVNPAPEVERSRGQQTPLSEASADFTIEHALAIAERFAVRAAKAKAILREVVAAVAGWRRVGKQLRLPSATLAAYESAFTNPCALEARRILRL